MTGSLGPRVCCTTYVVLIAFSCSLESRAGEVGVYDEPSARPIADPPPAPNPAAQTPSNPARNQSEPGGAARTSSQSAPGAPTTPTASGWASFNFDLANSRYNAAETALSAASVSSLRQAWRNEMPPGVTSTPAVVDGVVYVCNHDDAMVALDATTGVALWVRRGLVKWRCSSPLVGEQLVYFASGASLHALLRRDGSLVWSTVIDSHPDTLLDSSPVLAGDAILIGSASAEMIHDKADYTFRGSVVAVDATSGIERWRFETAVVSAGVSVWSSAAVDTQRNLMFVGTAQAYEAPPEPLSDSVIALDLDDGQLVWSRQFHADDVYTDANGCGGPSPCELAIGAAPNLFTAQGREVVGVGSKGGSYQVLDRNTGELVWARQLGPGGPLGGVMAVAAVGRGLVYVSENQASNSSTLFALDIDTGEVVWQVPMTSFTWGAVTLANDVVYLPTRDGRAHALRAADGVLLWDADLGHDAAGGISVMNGMLFAPAGFTGMGRAIREGGSLTAFSLP